MRAQQLLDAQRNAALPVGEGGLGLSALNTPMERAKALGYTVPSWHSSPSPDISRFNRRSWFANQPEMSETYLQKNLEGSSMYPVLINPEGFAEVDFGGNVWNQGPKQGVIKNWPEYNKQLSNDLFDLSTTDKAARETDMLMFPGVKISNVIDRGPNFWATPITGGDVYAVHNPSRIRSRFAAFDPMRREEGEILASHPLASAGAALAATGGLSGMAREYLNKPYDPGNQYAQYGMTPPMTRGEALKSAVGAVPGIGDVLAGAEALQAAGEGKWGEAGLNALGAAGMIPAGGIAGAIKASHGSPHAHTKFDFSKIGTGEGAQAYGHGGYFAQGFDSPVAQEYAKNLANINQATGLQTAHANAKNQVARFGNDPEWAAEVVADTMRNYDPKDAQYAALADTLKFIKSGDYAKPLQDEGYLYNVELKWPNAAKETADPLGEHHLLDWDAPYQQQPSHIQELLKNYYSDVVNKRTNIREGLQAKFAAQGKVAPIREEMSPVTGQQLYDQIASQLNSRELASNYLAEKGIPGIRYLDQGSRGYSEVFNVGAPVDNFGPYTPYYTQAAADEALKELQKYFPNAEIRKHSNPQTRNYVMFDERFPNIVSRNGVSLVDLLRK